MVMSVSCGSIGRQHVSHAMLAWHVPQAAAPLMLLPTLPRLCKTWMHSNAGMVAETGEATSRYLHSVARGEGGSEKAQADKHAEAMAARGLERVATMPRPSSAVQHMSTELVGAALLQSSALQLSGSAGLPATLSACQKAYIYIYIFIYHLHCNACIRTAMVDRTTGRVVPAGMRSVASMLRSVGC